SLALTLVENFLASFSIVPSLLNFSWNVSFSGKSISEISSTAIASGFCAKHIRIAMPILVFIESGHWLEISDKSLGLFCSIMGKTILQTVLHLLPFLPHYLPARAQPTLRAHFCRF